MKDKLTNVHGKYNIYTNRLIKAILSGQEFKQEKNKENTSYNVTIKNNFLSWNIQEHFTLSKQFIENNMSILKELKILEEIENGQ